MIEPSDTRSGSWSTARHRVQVAKVGLGERGTAWWEQSGAERRTRWETALSELDALED